MHSHRPSIGNGRVREASREDSRSGASTAKRRPPIKVN